MPEPEPPNPAPVLTFDADAEDDDDDDWYTEDGPAKPGDTVADEVGDADRPAWTPVVIVDEDLADVDASDRHRCKPGCSPRSGVRRRPRSAWEASGEDEAAAGPSEEDLEAAAAHFAGSIREEATYETAPIDVMDEGSDLLADLGAVPEEIEEDILGDLEEAPAGPADRGGRRRGHLGAVVAGRGHGRGGRRPRPARHAGSATFPPPS